MTSSLPMAQLQVPNTSCVVVSSPPSQTPTLVGYSMADELSDPSQHELGSNLDNSPEMTMAQPGPTLATVFPKVSITFLLGSGKRKTFDFEQSDSFATIKERLVQEWPTEWEGETKPQSAAAIRLLHLGRLIPDDESLSANPRFAPRPTPPTIIHLSVRPFTTRNPSTTGSLKAKASLLRTGNGFNFPGRGSANSPVVSSPQGQVGASAAETSHPLDSVEENQRSGCCCVIC